MPPARRTRSATAAVEFALVLPFLAVLVLGMIEISRILLVKETLSNAAQQACRTATKPGASNSQVTQEVADVLRDAGFTSYTVTIQVNDVTQDVSSAARRDKVSVRVSIPSATALLLSATFYKGATIESETVVMMRQG